MKKKASEIFGVKMEIFSRKNVIQVREKNFRPPKLGARSPPLDNPPGMSFQFFRGGCHQGNVLKHQKRLTQL